MKMNAQRRLALKLATFSLAMPTVFAKESQRVSATSLNIEKIKAAINQFAALEPNTSSCFIKSMDPNRPWQVGYYPERQLFVGSAVKTFILAQFLRDVENHRDELTEDKSVEISDTWRSLGSPVFGNLSGTTAYRNVLEAMINHSDNTATDILLHAVGVDNVRKLIKKAGLNGTKIPTSTRQLFSYLAGAQAGTDLGWSGMHALTQGQTLGLTERTDVINPYESMESTATNMVSWYEQSLQGKFFQKPETLVEYKRIQSMADALSGFISENILAFGKGGSIDWRDFHALCLPGQMIVNNTPVTFCFILNWRSQTQTSITRQGEFLDKAGNVLRETATLLYK